MSDPKPEKILWRDKKGENEYEAIIDDKGIIYKGFSFHPQAGGGFFGGFQSISEFLIQGGINDMPEKIEKAIRSEFLTLATSHELNPLKIIISDTETVSKLDIYFQINELPIKIMKNVILESKKSVTLYDGIYPLDEAKMEILVVHFQNGKAIKVKKSWMSNETKGKSIVEIKLRISDFEKFTV